MKWVCSLCIKQVIPFISTPHCLLLGPDWKKGEISPVLFDKTPNTSGGWWGLHPFASPEKAAHLCRSFFNPAGPLQTQHRAQTQQPLLAEISQSQTWSCCRSREGLLRRGLFGLVFLLNPVITLLTSSCAHSLKSGIPPSDSSYTAVTLFFNLHQTIISTYHPHRR